MTNPNSNGVSIDLASSQAVVASIGDTVGQMKVILGNIQSAAASGQKSWQGDASREFQSSHGEWQDIATRLNNALREMEANLTTSFKGYDNTDAELVGVVRQSAGGDAGLLKL